MARSINSINQHTNLGAIIIVNTVIARDRACAEVSRPRRFCGIKAVKPVSPLGFCLERQGFGYNFVIVATVQVVGRLVQSGVEALRFYAGIPAPIYIFYARVPRVSLCSECTA